MSILFKMSAGNAKKMTNKNQTVARKLPTRSALKVLAKYFEILKHSPSEFSNSQILKFSNSQIPQILKFSNSQILKFLNFQIISFSNRLQPFNHRQTFHQKFVGHPSFLLLRFSPPIIINNLTTHFNDTVLPPMIITQFYSDSQKHESSIY